MEISDPEVRMVPIIRKTILFIIIPVSVMAQSELYPPETFYGGGVGFSRMFLFTEIGELEGFELLGTVDDTVGLGLNTAEFTYPFIINGGEGFSNVAGRWRLGGYAGVGSSFISGKPEILLFLDLNKNGMDDDDTKKSMYINSPDFQAKVSILISGATVEYVFPLFRGLEVSTGALMGLGRLSLNISQSSGSPGWNEQFSSIFQLDPGETLYPVADVNGDTLVDENDLEEVQSMQYPSVAMRWGMTSRTGTFFNMQPYVAMKLQFLDRMGLRISVGFNLGKVTKGTWMTDDRKPISDSPATSLNSMAVRTMIYLGL